ncbi:MAG: shikimate dehydrogenase [Chitinophagales bacterium]
MKQYGLIGYPLTHSFSKKYFEDKFRAEGIENCAYDLYPIKDVAELQGLLQKQPKLEGLNVTIPYKEQVIELMDKLSPVAKEVGAVNCIKIEEEKTIGYNTDVFGFEKSLLRFLEGRRPRGVFVLGTGGSAKAVWYVLEKLDMPFLKVTRKVNTGAIGYADIPLLMQESNLFINTTPLGMYPEINACADIPYEDLNENDFLFDLVYNPAETTFLARGAAQKAKTKNGLEMLQLQAEESWRIWNS